MQKSAAEEWCCMAIICSVRRLLLLHHTGEGEHCSSSECLQEIKVNFAPSELLELLRV